MDPLKPGPPPLTTEWFEAQKKKMKEAGVEEPELHEKKVNDDVTLSQAAQGLPSTKGEKFLESVKAGLLELDQEDEEFLPKAARKLVDGVIGQEYGEHFTQNPAYPQMQEKIAQTLLDDPQRREAVEDFLQVFMLAQRGPDAPGGGSA